MNSILYSFGKGCGFSSRGWSGLAQLATKARGTGVRPLHSPLPHLPNSTHISPCSGVDPRCNECVNLDSRGLLVALGYNKTSMEINPWEWKRPFLGAPRQKTNRAIVCSIIGATGMNLCIFGCACTEWAYYMIVTSIRQLRLWWFCVMGKDGQE